MYKKMILLLSIQVHPLHEFYTNVQALNCRFMAKYIAKFGAKFLKQFNIFRSILKLLYIFLNLLFNFFIIY